MGDITREENPRDLDRGTAAAQTAEVWQEQWSSKKRGGEATNPFCLPALRTGHPTHSQRPGLGPNRLLLLHQIYTWRHVYSAVS